MYDAPFYKGSQKLRNKIALVTRADSGIGRAVAILFAREGADVAIAHLAEPADAAITRQAVVAEGACCLVIEGDVADRASCGRAVQRTAAGLGGLNVLVDNAAFQLHVSRFENLTEAHFDRTMKTSLYGYFHMAQAAVPKRPAQREEIAPAFVFLASPHCSGYINGEILPIINGYFGG